MGLRLPRVLSSAAYLLGVCAVSRHLSQLPSYSFPQRRTRARGRAHKEHGEENQQAKLLRPRSQHDENKEDEVHEVVRRALHTIYSPSLCLWNVLLEKLSHSEVKGPEAYGAAMQGEKKHGDMSEDLSKTGFGVS